MESSVYTFDLIGTQIEIMYLLTDGKNVHKLINSNQFDYTT